MHAAPHAQRQCRLDSARSTNPWRCCFVLPPPPLPCRKAVSRPATSLHSSLPPLLRLQGSFLPASVAEELAQMQQHEEVVEAGEVLRQLYQDLSSAREDLVRRTSMRLPRWAG